VRPSEIKSTKLSAHGLCSSLDLATQSLVRHLEASQGKRLLRFWVDYMVDHESQVWLVSTGPATFVRQGGLEAVASADRDAAVHRTKNPRSGFLGAAAGDMEKQVLDRSQTISPSPIKRKKKGRGYPGKGAHEEEQKLMEQQVMEASYRAEFSDHAEPPDPNSTSSSAAARQKEMSSSLIQPSFSPPAANLPQVPAPRPNSQEAASSYSTPTKRSNTLPTSFKCHGHFCQMVTHDPAPLRSGEFDAASDRDNARRIATQVLSEAEIK
jgi:hypothetical protein